LIDRMNGSGTGGVESSYAGGGWGSPSTAAGCNGSSQYHDDANLRDLAALNVYLLEKSKDPGNCVLFQTPEYPSVLAPGFGHLPSPQTLTYQQQPHHQSGLVLPPQTPSPPSQFNNHPAAALHHLNAPGGTPSTDADILHHYQQQWHYSLALTREFYRNKLDDESSTTSDLKSKLADTEIALKFKEGALSMKDNEIASLKSALVAFQQLSDEAVRGTKEGKYMYLSSSTNTAATTSASPLKETVSL
jgi:hypothetical protein